MTLAYNVNAEIDFLREEPRIVESAVAGRASARAPAGCSRWPCVTVNKALEVAIPRALKLSKSGHSHGGQESRLE
jgi:hypothetical protein